MKVAKILGILIAAYLGVIVVFESLLGYFQPAGQGTVVISSADGDGQTHDRVVSRLESGGRLYVAVNHWPRAWYGRVLENPQVLVTIDGTPDAYTAVPVTGEEYDRVNAEHPLGAGFRVLTGFPPRKILRLDPR